jgi:hypothetical protein
VCRVSRDLKVVDSDVTRSSAPISKSARRPSPHAITFSDPANMTVVESVKNAVGLGETTGEILKPLETLRSHWTRS